MELEETDMHHARGKNNELKSVTDQYRDVNVEITRGHNPDLKNVSVPKYTEEEHGTWALMCQKQIESFPDRASQEYRTAIKTLNLPTDHIPKLIDLSKIVENTTGWRITRVSGLVPEKEFFECLSQKMFPCTDFIRKREEIEYTPSPEVLYSVDSWG